MNTEIIKALAVTAEICGGEMSDAAARVMLADLSEYPDEKVLEALKRVRRENKGRLTLAAILERIDTGHPGAEEAWAMFPKSESDSGVVTQEMATAWGIAGPLYDEGDHIGARMAFKETYERELKNGNMPNWFLSGGHDKNGQEAAAIEGIRKGRLPVEMALQFVIQENRPRVLLAAGIKDHPLLIENGAN